MKLYCPTYISYHTDEHSADDYACGIRIEPWRALGRDAAGQPEVARMKWEEGSETVGDFVWWKTALDIVVKRSVAEQLRARFCCFEFGRIEMFQDPKFDKLKRKLRYPRILLPYTGPELMYLFITSYVPVDLDRSSFEWIERDGKRYLALQPVYERYETRFENGMPTGEIHIPREPGKGIFVHASDLRGASIFLLEQFPHIICFTEEVKRFCEDSQFTNVRFLEIGDVIEN